MQDSNRSPEHGRKPGSTFIVFFVGAAFFLPALPNPAFAQSTPTVIDASEPRRLNSEMADSWARLVLKGVDTEFPNKLSLVYLSRDQLKSPRENFPAFYGCYDWHSSVHGHWVLVRLLKKHPSIESASNVRSVLSRHLSEDNLRKEAEFFASDQHRTFERMYGWSWLFRLVIELDAWDDSDGKRWRDNLRPLEDILRKRVRDYLPRLTFPIRTGQHTDTGFALGQILDYARARSDAELETLVIDRARFFFGADKAYPVHYEPSGHDFFSSCWNEADLMRRLMPRSEYSEWLQRFLPNLVEQLGDGTIEPVSVSDVTDPKIVHLAGLNLNRAWCMRGIAASLDPSEPVVETLRESARAHLAAGLNYVNSGHYEGDHWLATFALYAIDDVGFDNGD